MDNKEGVRSNDAVIESLDSLTNYASQYKDRLGSKDEDEKKKEQDFVNKYLQKNKNQTIQEQIAETLRLAKLKEDEKNKREAQKKRDKEINQQIIDTFNTFYEEENEIITNFETYISQFVMEQVEMDILAFETQQIIEKEERKRKEKEKIIQTLKKQEEERQRIIAEEKKKAEEEMKNRIMKELQFLKEIEQNKVVKLKQENIQKTDSLIQKQKEEYEFQEKRAAEEERSRELQKIRLVQEEAKKMTLLSAMKNFVKDKVLKSKTHENVKVENASDKLSDNEDKTCLHNENLRKILDDDRRIAEELRRKIKEEDELKSIAAQAEEARRAEMFEHVKKMELKKKIKSLEKPQSDEEVPKLSNMEHPVKNSMLIPLLTKFEQLSKIAEEEENASKKIKKRKRTHKLKAKSKQVLNKLLPSIKISEKNIFSKNCEKETDKKDDMKNYLISHVLFDGNENIKSVNKEQKLEMQKEESIEKVKNNDGFIIIIII